MNKATYTDKDKLAYFIACIAKDRNIKTEYFEFDKQKTIRSHKNQTGSNQSRSE